MSTKTKIEKAWDDNWLCCSLPPTGSSHNVASTFKKDEKLKKHEAQVYDMGDKKVVIFTERVQLLEGVPLYELLKLKKKIKKRSKTN